MEENRYQKQAEKLANAIRAFNENPGTLENFEVYLSMHFDEWMKKWAYSPDTLANEFFEFSTMI